MSDMAAFVMRTRALSMGGAAAALTASAMLISSELGVVIAVLVIVVMIERAREHGLARADELARELAQVEPLIALSARLPARRPLPPMREFAIAPDFALLLHELVLDERPAVVVETGSGVSTLVIAYALEQLGRGHLHSLEHDPRHAARTRELLERHGLVRWATVHDAPLEPITIDGERYTWHATRALDGVGAIDLVVDDGPPRHLGPMLRYASLPVFAPRLAPGATFVLDVVGVEERAILARWRARFPDLAQEHLDTKKGNVIIRRRADAAVRPAQEPAVRRSA